ncbi:MAG: hypothetical protein ACT4O2_02395, partial [Beijerinckiaceae bacterium]
MNEWTLKLERLDDFEVVIVTDPAYLGELCKSSNPVILLDFRRDDSPMPRRCFSQPSLAGAFVKAYSR